ncbi:hypothetical protein HK098_005624 [Nowakowskiella sp. JEL0407]|nr:hypothetical protein HK098_005624 [Nowakowskiella sp. JEL0407]
MVTPTQTPTTPRSSANPEPREETPLIDFETVDHPSPPTQAQKSHAINIESVNQPPNEAGRPTENASVASLAGSYPPAPPPTPNNAPGISHESGSATTGIKKPSEGIDLIGLKGISQTLLERIQLWRRTIKTLIRVFQDQEDLKGRTIDSTSKTLSLLSDNNKPISFPDSSGINRLMNDISLFHESILHMETETRLEIERKVLPGLENLNDETKKRERELIVGGHWLDKDISTFSDSHQNFKDRLNQAIASATDVMEGRATNVSAGDPWLINLEWKHFISSNLPIFHKNQTSLTNELHAFQKLDSTIITTLRSLLGEYFEKLLAHESYLFNQILTEGVLKDIPNIDELREWKLLEDSHPGDNLNLVSRTLSVQSPNMECEEMNHPLTKPIKEGVLARKDKVSGLFGVKTGFWKSEYFVVTPVGWLHTFPQFGIEGESEAQKARKGKMQLNQPEWELFLKDCDLILGEDEHEFVLKEKKESGLFSRDKGTHVIRAETPDDAREWMSVIARFTQPIVSTAPGTGSISTYPPPLPPKSAQRYPPETPPPLPRRPTELEHRESPQFAEPELTPTIPRDQESVSSRDEKGKSVNVEEPVPPTSGAEGYLSDTTRPGERGPSGQNVPELIFPEKKESKSSFPPTSSGRTSMPPTTSLEAAQPQSKQELLNRDEGTSTDQQKRGIQQYGELVGSPGEEKPSNGDVFGREPVRKRFFGFGKPIG